VLGQSMDGCSRDADPVVGEDSTRGDPHLLKAGGVRAERDARDNQGEWTARVEKVVMHETETLMCPGATRPRWPTSGKCDASARRWVLVLDCVDH
jgi:hypothetical protein